MDGRDIVRGGISCPVCRAEYPILDRVAWLAPVDEPVLRADFKPRTSELTAEAAQTFLDLQGPGGFVVTFGEAGRLLPELAALLPGVGVAGVNVPGSVTASARVSVIWSPVANPIKAHTIRGAIVGPDAARSPWIEGAVAAVLPGLRVIFENDALSPAGVDEIVRGAGVLVSERRNV